jgi:toxin ParE1/3/4
MTRVVYAARARRELIRIADTIALDNRRAADKFAAQIAHFCALLATTPEMGRPQPEVGHSIRSLVQGNYLIFYRWRSERGYVEILCVRHGSRRLPRLR